MVRALHSQTVDLNDLLVQSPCSIWIHHAERTCYLPSEARWPFCEIGIAGNSPGLQTDHGHVGSHGGQSLGSHARQDMVAVTGKSTLLFCPSISKADDRHLIQHGLLNSSAYNIISMLDVVPRVQHHKHIDCCRPTRRPRAYRLLQTQKPTTSIC